VDINQVYRAPSIPKLGKKTVSSSVLRGAAATTAAAPKLGKTRFSFLKPKISAENLKTEVSPVSVEQSLAETNRILVEIQKQLSLDFANRIAEEKELLKNVKKAESKRKFAAREKFAEGTRKISGAVGGVVDKVSAPIKSVFDKIKEFFGLILTGIVVNKAFDWLQKEENRQKLDKIFNFIGTYWKEITAAIVGIQLASTLGALAGTITTISAILANPLFLVPLAVFVGGIARIKEQERIKPFYEKDLKEAEKTLESEDAPWYQKLGASIFKGQVQRGPASTGLDFRAPGSMYSTGGTIPSTSYNFNPSVVQKFSGGGSVRGYADGGTFWERLTGTVRGAGSMMVDSVKALLAPGEEIIRATSAMLFRPLLKDINDNAGRLWVTFSKAILKLLSVNESMLDRSNEFAKVIEEFDGYLKDQVAEERRKNQYNTPTKPRIFTAGPGPGGFSPSTKATKITSAPKVTNVVMASPGGSGGMTLLPMVLPTQKSKPPEIPQMQGRAGEIQAISPIDFSNPWMDISPEWYGIQLYG
jgi:hypothetical protein